MNSYFSESQLMQAPVKRAAFSERMAYQMAEMSRLAYFKFEGGHTIVEFISETRKFIKDEEATILLEHLAKMLIPVTIFLSISFH